jgi:IS5 family transposase
MAPPSHQERIMEARLYRQLYDLVWSVAHPPRKRVRFGDRIIVLVYLWSVLHDRPVGWACEPENWRLGRARGPGPDFELPSQSTMSDRLRTTGVQQLVERVMAAASDVFGVPLVKQIDSKPLLVGAYSKDPDAAKGRVANGLFSRGYRLHTLNHGRVPRQFVVAPMNQHDAAAAPALLKKLEGGGYVPADNAYDSNELHRQAAQRNHQLVAPARAKDRKVRDARRNCPQRLRALDLLDDPLKNAGLAGGHGRFGRDLYNCRQRVESGYGGLTLLGLHYLPAWVRGPRRVALWAAGKILIHLCRCAQKLPRKIRSYGVHRKS